ncbi:MAG TPA: DNA-binding response regulator [Cyanobacteria bacterium UBA11370]|nr:DNA-binding response regulator [Cyanobacteria bacterium UBA11370]HBY80360.1 DNA-binding response regulator [Cyanobacteria bacterium UBA11148]
MKLNQAEVNLQSISTTEDREAIELAKTYQVLVVEDHEFTRMGIGLVLKKEKAKNPHAAVSLELVGECGTAAQCLQLNRSVQADVVIVDIGLPDMDGIQLTKALKTRDCQGENDNSIPKVLILTSWNSEEVVLAAFEAGADSYCRKTLDPSLLYPAVKATAIGEHFIDPAIASVVLGYCKNSQVVHEEDVSNSHKSSHSNSNADYNLSPREYEVLELIVNGYSNGEIAEQLYLSVASVKVYVRNLFRKLACERRTQIAVQALREGIIS